MTKTKNFANFQNFQKSNFDGGKLLKIWSSINLPWGHARSHKKCGPDRFSRFDVYWIQTNKQTPRQAKFIYRYRFPAETFPVWINYFIHDPCMKHLLHIHVINSIFFHWIFSLNFWIVIDHSLYGLKHAINPSIYTTRNSGRFAHFFLGF